VRGGVRQWIDDLELLDYGTRPAMRDDDRQSIPVPGAYMDEVNIHAVDIRHELGQAFEPRLDAPPVVIGRPILRELAHRFQLHALRVVANKLPTRPFGGGDAATQIG